MAANCMLQVLKVMIVELSSVGSLSPRKVLSPVKLSTAVTALSGLKQKIQMQNTLGQVINPLSSQRRLCLQPHCPDDGR